MEKPPRGFTTGEFEARLARAQRLMDEQHISALLLTTEPEVRYFTGFLTQFWQSPTRPWFLVVPAQGKPIAVIPEIGAAYMAQTWIDDIRTWPSPASEDDGVSLLEQTLQEVAGATGCVGLPIGPETHLRMPLADFDAIRARCANEFVDATALMRELRMGKSEAEIAKIAYICDVVSTAFDALPGVIAAGDTQEEAFRTFKIEILRQGADDVPYLVGGAGQHGYAGVISPPSAQPLREGDVVMLDTGSLFDGYFCDFDRNFAIGRASDSARRAYETLYRATEAGLRAALPGATCADLFQSMWRELEADGQSAATSVGRLGHGLGMQLTEWPSNTPSDHTVLQPGMVLTLEPAMSVVPGRMMVHEENVVIREDGPQLLTQRAPPELPTV